MSLQLDLSYQRTIGIEGRYTRSVMQIPAMARKMALCPMLVMQCWVANSLEAFIKKLCQFLDVEFLLPLPRTFEGGLS